MIEEQELENRELQNEEMMALEAIYPDAFQIDTSSPNAFLYTLDLDQENNKVKSPRKLVVRFFLPPTYPNQDMPIYEISSIYCGSKKVDDAMIDAIDTGFQSLFHRTEVVLFEWISWLREFLDENVPLSLPETIDMNAPSLDPSETIPTQHDEEEDYQYNPEDYEYKAPSTAIISESEETLERPTVRSLMGANTFDQEIPPTIFTSEALLDRKSSFVAHVAQVNNIHEVKVVVARLLQNKKIAKATHNILAYRIIMPNGKVLQDNDDDGESAAGGRLLHLMQILEVENVVVVVTRWFGGIHLGPDRFKDINNVARNALETCGFINEKQSKVHSSKQRKK